MIVRDARSPNTNAHFREPLLNLRDTSMHVKLTAFNEKFYYYYQQSYDTPHMCCLACSMSVYLWSQPRLTSVYTNKYRGPGPGEGTSQRGK